ncbi:MAG: hypothetical protein ABIY48_12560 [Acidimicrobiales bacterium]
MDDLDESPTLNAPPQDAVARRRVSALVVAVSLALLFAVAATILAVVLAGKGDTTKADDLRATAGRFGEALVSYDFHHPKAHRDAVLSFATGSFREEYQAAFDQGLGKIITEVKATSKGFVKDVYLSDIDAERAQAIVVVDIEHSGANGPSTLYDVYFRLTLVRVGDRWKVDQVTDLNFDNRTGTPVTTDTSGSPATSVP